MSVDPAMQRFVMSLDLGEQAVRRHAYALDVSAQQQMAARQGIPAPSVPTGSTGTRGQADPQFRFPFPGSNTTQGGAPPTAASAPAWPPFRWPPAPGAPSPAASPGGASAGQQPGSPQLGGFQLTSAINANTAAITANTIALQKGGAGKGTAGGGGGKGGTEKEFDLEKSTEKFRSFGAALESFSARGRASFLSLVASADSSSFSTFQAKIEMVAIAVGEVFEPYVRIASKALHNFADWFSSLDDTTKEWIGTLGVSAVAIAGLGGALLTTGAWFVSSYNIIRTSTAAQWTWIAATRVATAAKWLLATAVRGVGTALMFLFANPVGLAITAVAGLAAGVMYLAGAFDRLGASAGTAGNQIQGATNQPGLPGQVPNQPQTLAQAMAPLSPQQQTQLLAPGLTQQQRSQIIDTIEQTATQQLQTQRQSSVQGALAEQYIHRLVRDQNTANEQTGSLQIFRDPNATEHGKSLMAAALQGRAPRDIESALSKSTYAGSATLEQLKRAIQADKQTGKLSLDPTVIFSTVGQPNANLPSIQSLEKILQAIPEIRRMSGIQGQPGQPGQPGGRPYTENIKMPFNARYTDTMSFLENVQTQALNVGSADAQNRMDEMVATLKRIGDNLLTAEQMATQMSRLEFAISKLKIWR